jgi:F-type H+-transporting ATPase subunit delta
MKSGAAAKRYAKALFDLAREQDHLEAIRADIGDLTRLLEESPDFARFVADPLIPADKRGEVLVALLKDRADPLTARFLAFLDSRDRLDQLPGICSVFTALYNDIKGILLVEITSAVPLSAEQVDQVEKRLHVKFGKQIESTQSTDPALLGGFKVRVGDTIHDYSIATQLQTLKQKLINA